MPITCFVKWSTQKFMNNWHRNDSDPYIQPWFSIICTMTIFFALYWRLVSFAVPVQLQMFSTFGSSCSFGRSLNRQMSRLLLILGEVCWEPGKTNTIIKPSPSFFSVRHRPPKIWFQEPLQKWDESRLRRKTAKQKVALRQRDLKKIGFRRRPCLVPAKTLKASNKNLIEVFWNLSETFLGSPSNFFCRAIIKGELTTTLFVRKRIDELTFKLMFLENSVCAMASNAADADVDAGSNKSWRCSKN